MSTEVLTIGQIADLLDESPARVNYIIAKKRIKPSARVANARLFGEVAVERIRLELHNREKKRKKKTQVAQARARHLTTLGGALDG